jgi:hypothetical protein
MDAGEFTTEDHVGALSFPELHDLVSREVEEGFWQHAPRVIFDCWQTAGGKRTSEETTEQRQIGRWRNSYVFLEGLGNVKSVSHVLNGRVLLTKTLAQAMFLDMLSHWTFDSKSDKTRLRSPIRDLPELRTAADQLVSLIFSRATDDEQDGFKVTKLRVKEQRYEEFADQLANFSDVYILSRYRSIRGLGREQALSSLFEDQSPGQYKGSATAIAEFADSALASSLHATNACWTWICDFGIAPGRGSDDSDWLAYLNFSDLRAAFYAFLHIHTPMKPALVREAYDRCRFVVKNSPTLAPKRAELFKDIEFIESLSRDTATLTATPLPDEVPSEWKSLLVGPRGQVQHLFPQTILVGHREKFEFYYFPGDLDSEASIDTLLIDENHQPTNLVAALHLVSQALDSSSSAQAREAQKTLAFLNWDILSLQDLMKLKIE